MIFIENNWIGAALAFGVGAVIAVLNYGFSVFMLKKHSGQYAASQLLKQLLQIGYLAVLYFFGGYTPWSKLWLLVGGCLGMTLPALWFTYRLVKLNEGKEESKNG